MQVADKVVVVTGAARGIGRAMAERFVREGAKHVVASDIDAAALHRTADEIGALAHVADVTREEHVGELIAATEANCGADRLILLECGHLALRRCGSLECRFRTRVRHQLSIAPVCGTEPRAQDDGARRGLLAEHGIGCGSANPDRVPSVRCGPSMPPLPWPSGLAIAHGDQGLRVSVLCPQGVRTRLLLGEHGERGQFPHARSTGAVRCRRPCHRRTRRGALSDPAASGGRRIHAPQDRGLRPLAPRHAPGCRRVCEAIPRPPCVAEEPVGGGTPETPCARQGAA